MVCLLLRYFCEIKICVLYMSLTKYEESDQTLHHLVTTRLITGLGAGMLEQEEGQGRKGRIWVYFITRL